MAYYSKNGSGIDSSAYIYVQLQVTRTDYPTYSRFSVKSVAVSDTGTSSFIRGQVTTNQAGNSWTAATGWKDVSYNGTTTLATATFDVARGASDKTAHIGAYAEGGGTGIYSGGTDYAWLNVTVPKVLAPNAPTGCTATYVSDSQASVSWTNGTTDSDHPRDATLVERRDGSNEWAQVASVSGTASGYTDNGISANTQYQYRVRAKNVAGYSAYSTSGSIYTTPAAPSSVTLDKTAATTVQVDVTGTWGYSVTYDVESTYDGGSTWATVATSTSLPYSATVNAGTVQFRVRAVRGALSSAWTNSASLVTICPPLAPTIVQAPANPTAFGDSSAISWTPNHPDGSAQASAEVKVTNPGGTSTTYTVSTATSYSFTPNATGTWTAQVRTKGLDPSYGEWSQSVSWAVANPPAVVITSPATDGTDVVSLPMTVSWSVTDSTGVSAQRIIIEGSDGEILNRTLAGDVRSVSLNASDVALENGKTYTIRLRVMGGSGLVTEQTRIFDVAWLAPAAPVLQLTEGEGASAQIIATAGEEGAATNLAPFFSMPLTGSYWASVSDGIAIIGNGWARFEVSDGAVFNVATIPTELQPSTQYTVLVEFRNVSGAATVSLGDWAVQIQGTNVAVRDGLFSASGSNATINATYGTSGTDIQFAEKDVFASAVSAGTDGGNAYLLGTTRSNLADASVFVGGTVSGQVSMDMRLSIYEGEYDGPYAPYNAPATQAITVQRVNPDGTAWTVATGLTVGGSCIDPLPPLGVPVTYRAVGTAPSGATSSGSYTETIGGREWVLNFGNAAQEHVELMFNPRSTLSLDQGGESYHFADGGAGNGLPVWYGITDRDISGSLRFDTNHYGDTDVVIDLCNRYPVAWLRDPYGHRWRAHVRPSLSHDYGGAWPVTLNWDAVRFKEAW